MAAARAPGIKPAVRSASRGIVLDLLLPIGWHCSRRIALLRRLYGDKEWSGAEPGRLNTTCRGTSPLGKPWRHGDVELIDAHQALNEAGIRDGSGDGAEVELNRSIQRGRDTNNLAGDGDAVGRDSSKADAVERQSLARDSGRVGDPGNGAVADQGAGGVVQYCRRTACR